MLSLPSPSRAVIAKWLSPTWDAVGFHVITPVSLSIVAPLGRVVPMYSIEDAPFSIGLFATTFKLTELPTLVDGLVFIGSKIGSLLSTKEVGILKD